MYPDDLLYSKDHEWVRQEGESLCIVGITHFAQEELGDVVFVELPEQGQPVAENDEMGTIESVKAVAEVYSPVAGKVEAVNGQLEEQPELVNQDPYGDGWLVKIRLAAGAGLEELMDAAAYRDFVEEGG